MSTAETKNKGAVKGGNGNYVFDLTTPATHGCRCRLLERRGSGGGGRAHPGRPDLDEARYRRARAYPSERTVDLPDEGQGPGERRRQPERISGPGTLIYLPANIVHYMQALPEEDVQFFTCKDMSHGIMGKATDGTMAGPHVDPGVDSGKK